MFAFYLSIAAVCLIAVVIVKFIKSPETRGAKGETIVARILGRTIDGEQYVIHDLLFRIKTAIPVRSIMSLSTNTGYGLSKRRIFRGGYTATQGDGNGRRF